MRATRTLPWMAAAAGLLLALPALAGPPGGGFGGPPDGERLGRLFEMRAERLAEALDLTAEQRAAYERIRDEARTAAQAKRDRMQTLREETRALLDGAAPDPTLVGQKAIELHQLRGELRATHEQAKARFEALLDDTQKAQLEALDAMRPAGRRGDRMGRPPRGPRPSDRPGH